jgi:hypothetical protein
LFYIKLLLEGECIRFTSPCGQLNYYCQLEGFYLWHHEQYYVKFFSGRLYGLVSTSPFIVVPSNIQCFGELHTIRAKVIMYLKNDNQTYRVIDQSNPICPLK